ncbi:phosphoserine phosphatase SerB [Altererythrobacter sp. JGD-16]|uniref:Phosphoserine phosphatase n=1 Tax=Altererythrobacter lutimaris TaxID=2743979 RepID=A0A850H7F9_9SPHN|nr:phosphoserine phosphatase SerB [Altererythrobacter lutimaris]
MPIVRLIADPASLESVDHQPDWLDDAGVVLSLRQLSAELFEFDYPIGPAEVLDRILDELLKAKAALISANSFDIPQVFISDMDSTMIGQECIDELADYAGLKNKIADITERAMQGELDFEQALRERVGLLAGLEESAIQQCLDERITPMAGARTLVQTLKANGCRTVLVTGGFHHFADPVADMLGFERVVGNRLKVASGKLTGGLLGDIVDSSVKKQVLEEEVAAAGEGTISLATGDGANDIPMLEAAAYGFAYHAKPKARAAANGRIDQGDLTAVLKLLGIPEGEWVIDN